MTTEFWIQMIVYAVSLGSFGGMVITKLNNLEKKQDKHNGLMERMVVVEQSVKSAHHRIDEIKEEYHEN
ncbi:hypothetical protein [Aminipila luticellarii]|uniref:Phage protein n=1 Tax=Aminipila luticellarii TaxID=2507160 RepID=A0A410PWV7_9FIRM|nr:hypothetical protein [Aminipila luticellarii]QAT43428.1 hypothetical protein EQM06_09495 [Aminipila luticellarii]